MKVKLEIEFEEEYDADMFFNMLTWHTDKENWKEDDCIHIKEWKEIDERIVEPASCNDITCNDCAWHVRAHYKGTPDDEVYDECECHCEVLHDLKVCDDFTTQRDE